MTRKQQKWIALAVAITFMWLLQVSAMPLPAAGNAVTAAGADQGTDFYEAIGQQAAPAKKKSILPLVLIGAGALGIAAAVLFLVVLKGYDVTGGWNFVFILGSDTESIFITFSGSKTSGTWVSDVTAAFSGTYAVDGKKVTMTVTSSPELQFIGQFSSKDQMSGTYGMGSTIFNWTATRSAAAAALKPTSEIQSRYFPK